MKTEVGHFYVFVNSEDFWEKVKYWKSEGYYWIHESHPDYNPNITQEDMPCALSVSKDDSGPTMMHGIVKYNRERYFANDMFVKLYKQEMRKYKLKRIYIK